MDSAGNVYVGVFGRHVIQKFTSTGTLITQWGSLGSGNGQFNAPQGVAVDTAGNVYVADKRNNRIQKFSPTTSTGESTSRSWDFGDGGTSTFQNPSHLYSDAGTCSVTLTVTTTSAERIDQRPGTSQSAAP